MKRFDCVRLFVVLHSIMFLRRCVMKRFDCVRLFVVLVLSMSASVVNAGLIDVTAPGNLLAGETTASSSSQSNTPATETVDNQVGSNTEDDGLLFNFSDPDQRLSISGFNSGLGISASSASQLLTPVVR